MNVYIKGMAQLWNIPDEAPEMETEVEIRTTEDPLEKGMKALVLSGACTVSKTIKINVLLT